MMIVSTSSLVYLLAFFCLMQLHPSAQIITAQPDITETKLDKGDDFIVLACDGIWDVMTKCANI